MGLKIGEDRQAKDFLTRYLLSSSESLQSQRAYEETLQAFAYPKLPINNIDISIESDYRFHTCTLLSGRK